MNTSTVAVVLIGRNEGDRLVAALEALPKDILGAVYVDSGSTDGSRAAAQAAGVDVVELDLSIPFTAARARNVGVAYLKEAGITPDFIQFIDGDCCLQPEWLGLARRAMAADPRRAVVCGRRRERFPDNSIYNWLIDREWDTPIGLAKASGGDALIRSAAFNDVGGYRDDMIAGEEPEMCVRLRQSGWTIERIDAEMTLHDAAIDRFSQWWRRARRAGHAYAEGAYRHGAAPERHNVSQTIRALMWGAALPVAIVVLSIFVSPWALLGVLVWPLLMVRQVTKGRPSSEAFFQTIGKFPETLGVFDFHLRRLRGGPSELIEYK